MILSDIFLYLIMDFVCCHDVLFKCVYPQGFSYVCLGKEGKGRDRHRPGERAEVSCLLT